MTFRSLLRGMLVLGVTESLAIGGTWLWHARHPSLIEAQARIQVRRSEVAGSGRTEPDGPISPTQVAAALELLQQRHVEIDAPAGESEAAFLGRHLEAAVIELAGQDEYILTYSAISADDADDVLTAVIDAYRAALAARTSPRAIDDLDRLNIQCAELGRTLESHKLAATAAQTALAESDVPEPERLVRTERLKSLAIAHAESRRRRIEAEARLAQAQQDLAAGLPEELFAARLPDGELKEFFHELLRRARLSRELQEQSAKLEQMATVYGRLHPRRLEAQARLEQLAQQAADAHVLTDEGPPSSGQLLLQALRSELQEAQQVEQELEMQAAAQQRPLELQARLRSNLERAQQTFAQAELEKTRLESQRQHVVRRQAESQGLEVLASPSVISRTIFERHKITFGLAAAAGGALGLLLACGLSRRTETPDESETASYAHPGDSMVLDLAQRRRARTASLASAIGKVA